MCFTASVISLLPHPREREQQQKVLGPFVSELSFAACPVRLISSDTHHLEKNLCYWIPGYLLVYPKPMGPLYFLFQKAMFLPASHPCHLLSRTVKSLEILPNLEASTSAPQPVAVSWMLAEDMGLVVLRQRSVYQHSQQHELPVCAIAFSPMSPQLWNPEFR